MRRQLTHPFISLLLGAGLLACAAHWAAAQEEAQQSGQMQEEADEEAAGELPLEDLRIFADVYNQIRSGYVEEVPDSKLLEYAIEGMLQGLDPHSVYLTGRAFDDLQTTTTGEFSGLGLEVGVRDGLITIIAPIDGTPAAEAGLQSGDVILKLDDVSAKGMGLGDAVDRMRGEKGTEIELMIGRPGESQPFSITLIRDTVKVASVRERWLQPGYGYIRVAQFQKNTGDDVKAALERLMQSELRGLVLDLRNNPGGVLEASVEVAGLFLDGGVVVYTEGRLENAGREYSADPHDQSNGTPLVVLINGGSASASEIVAGALQDHRRAVIMGTDSFGKGSVQTILPVSEERAVKLTTALYFTPDGRSIQAQGIVPDVLVERAKVTSLEQQPRLSEADLERHLDSIGGDDEKAQRQRVEIETAAEILAEDNQLYEALTLLKGIHILGRNSLRHPGRGESGQG